MKIPFYLFSVALAASLSVAQETATADSSVSAAVDTTVVPEPQQDSSVVNDTTVASEPLQEAPVVDTTVATEPQQEAPVAVDTKAAAEPQQGTPSVEELEGFLKAKDSPYQVTQNIRVKKNSVLVIEPGVILEFAEGTGLHAEGQLVIAGSKGKKVTFRAAPSSKSWKGITIATEGPVEIRNAIISGAENAIAVENSVLNLQNSTIEKSAAHGLVAKNSKVNASDCQFNENAGVAFYVSHYSEADIQRVMFQKNNVALLNSELAKTSVSASNFQGNTYGILDKGNAILNFSNTRVSGNQNGVSTQEILDKSVIESISGNAKDFDENIQFVEASLPAAPEIPGVESRPYNAEDNMVSVFTQDEVSKDQQDSTLKRWSVIGNVMLGGSYHKVMTKRNHSGMVDVVDGDPIQPGKRYKNLFQTPGFAGEASAYMLMQAPNGSTLEFEADLTADSWNHFSPNTIAVTYKDDMHRGVIGDFQKINGDIYMSSLPIFGAGYTLSLLKNNADQPLFEIDAFVGEAQRSLVIGERHPNMYNNYIEDGEAQAQRQVVGGAVKWAPFRRFDASVGALYANDAIKDPFIRKGGSTKTVTSEPLQKSFTIYADGNWLFYPGDIELKGQIAMGRADTNEVLVERAVNEVLQDAGVSTASYNKIRQLMSNENEINNMSTEEMEEIFGLNTTMSRKEMREALFDLVQKARKNKKDAIQSHDDEKVLGMKWSGQNLALGASLFWNIYKTTISGHIRYVGEDYFSVGSSDLLSDTREFGGNIEQIISKFWSLNFGYQISVENASSNDRANVFGLGEGTSLGFFGDPSDSWKKEHELDQDRTKYIQNFSLANSIQVNSNVHVNVAYGLEYRTQHRPYRIHGSFSNEEIYKDKWFAPRKGKDTVDLVLKDGNFKVDAERWNVFRELEKHDFWATDFQERLMKHTLKADVSFKANRTAFKVGGVFNIRRDMSVFENDSLIEDINLSNKTWSKLGYYFGGANFFEHSYPITATTTLDNIQNKASITPRFKNYERDNMDEGEITLEDNIQIPLLNRFLVLGADATFRFLSASWDEDNSHVEESEIDVLGNVSVRVNHTKRLYSEWFAGTAMYYRPENISNQYKDIFCGARVNYEF